MSSCKIIQWNCQEISNKKHKLTDFISKGKPEIKTIQETEIKKDSNFNFRNHNTSKRRTLCPSLARWRGHFHRWKIVWENDNNNKLKAIKQNVNKWKENPSSPRRKETLINRLRRGLTLTTHEYLKTGGIALPCDLCYQESITISYLLTRFYSLDQTRTEVYCSQTPENPEEYLG